MARKERNDIDYFPHKVTHGRKMFYLRSKYKNDGYAVWFMLLEHLGKSDYHYLDLEDKIQVMYLSSDLLVSEEMLYDIISTLVDFKEFDKELWENYKILYNQEFVNSISDAYKKRNNVCIDKNSLILLLKSKGKTLLDKSKHNEDITNLKGGGNTQTKLNYTKLKETIPLETPAKAVAPAIDVDKFIEWFNALANRKFKATKNVKADLKARIKDGYTKSEIMSAAINAHKSQYHIESSFQHLTPEFILRTEKLEKYKSVNEPVKSEEKIYSPVSIKIDHSNIPYDGN